MSHTERFVRFDCDGDAMVGVCHLPQDTASNIGVLVIVGGPQYRVGSHRQFVALGRYLAQHGVPVLRFDSRGMGDSAGVARPFDGNGSDVRAAVDAFDAQFGIKKIVLYGLCDAASSAMIYAHTDPRIVGLILLNPWVQTDAAQAKALVGHYYGGRLLSRAFWRKLLGGGVSIGSALAGFLRSVRASRAVDRGTSADAGGSYVVRMRDGLARFTGPVQLVLCGRDLVARQFEDLCRTDPIWSSLMGRASCAKYAAESADHTFANRAELLKGFEASLRWIRTIQSQ